jgi:erythromycin esterase-like protein
VVGLLAELRRGGQRATGGGSEAQFDAEQNAWVVKNAEQYYRTMIRGGPESWNIRDRHMTQTLERLMQHHGPAAKAIVWEHNTHIGDARHTDMAGEGMVNVGQLVREEHGTGDVVLIGFTTHRGSVVAGRAWDAPWETMDVPPARQGSWDDLLHRAAQREIALIFDERQRQSPLAEQRGQRAIGVVYHPQRERGNYVPTLLPRRYDAVLHIDETHALRPLHGVRPRGAGEVPETYPTGV